VLPWALLVIGSLASLAANVAVAEPSLSGRVIAAWPSFALIGSYELLMRHVRRASALTCEQTRPAQAQGCPVVDSGSASAPTRRSVGDGLRRHAWQWALTSRDARGFLPSGKVIGDRYGRQERWGRLVKSAGAAGKFEDSASGACIT
jgi:hypothetical protein